MAKLSSTGTRMEMNRTVGISHSDMYNKNSNIKIEEWTNMSNIAHLIIKRQAYTVDSSGLLHVYDINRTKMNTLLANIQCTELSRQI